MTLTRVPTLDELAADPKLAEELPVTAAQALLTRCLIIQSALWTRQLAVRSDAPEAQNADTLLNVPEAAKRLSATADWVYRHAKDLPFTVKTGRQLRFSRLGIERYIREHAGIRRTG